MRPGDVVVQVSATRVANTAQLLNAVAVLKPGEAAKVQVQRGNEALTLDIVPAKRPRNAANGKTQRGNPNE